MVLPAGCCFVVIQLRFLKENLVQNITEVLCVRLPRPGVLYLSVQLVFFITRNKLTKFT